MPHNYKPQILKLKEKLGIPRSYEPDSMNSRGSHDPDGPLRNEDIELTMSTMAAAGSYVAPEGEDPGAFPPSEPAYYDLYPLYEPLMSDEIGSFEKEEFLNNLFNSLLVIDGAYDVAAAVEDSIEGNNKPSDKALLKAAIKHGHPPTDEGVTAYKNSLIAESIDKVAGRSTVLGSLLISAFKGLLYFFRVDINKIISDYLRGESDVERRGRKLTNFEVLFKDSLTREEATGTTGNSYLVSLIQAETGMREDMAGFGYAEGEFGVGFTDLNDLR